MIIPHVTDVSIVVVLDIDREQKIAIENKYYLQIPYQFIHQLAMAKNISVERLLYYKK